MPSEADACVPAETPALTSNYGGIDAARSVVELAAADVHPSGVVFCPNPRMPLWSGHPKVFIDLSAHGAGVCAYCGTEYRLKAGEHLAGGH